MAKKSASKKKSGKKAVQGKSHKLDMDQLLGKIVTCLVRHSPRELSFSMVSRLTGVPRPTLYYYFSSSKDGMIREAVAFGMKALVQLYEFEHPEKIESKEWNEFQKKRLKRAVSFVEKFPWAPGLFFRYRNDPSEIGNTIRHLENQFCEKTSEAWRKKLGTKPDLRSVRLSAYLKIGLLYGLSIDGDLWYGEQGKAAGDFNEIHEKLSAKLTQVVAEIMEMRF